MKRNDSRYRIVFMGTPDFAVPALTRLITGPDEVVAVVTQPDRPRGRGRRLVPSSVKAVATRYGLEVLQPKKVSEEQAVKKLSDLSPDLFVVCAFGQILPQKVLDIPRIMPINIHGSLLPKYRGAAPIQWAILNGETETGITIMRMDAGMDTGPMLLRRSMPIGKDTTFGELSSKMAELGADALMEALDLLEKGRLREEEQPAEGVTYAPPIKKEQLMIDWNQSAWEIHCQLRAFDPKPGAWSTVNGQRVRFFEPHMEEGDSKAKPGTLIKAGPKRLVVACGRGLLGIGQIQWPGKKRLSVEAFLRGKGLEEGTILG